TQGDRASLEYRPESAGQEGLRGSALVSQIQKEIELIRYNYASSIGIWINKNGTIESLSTRRPTRDEEKFLESLAALYFSVQALENNSPTAGERRNNLLKVREDYQTVETIWRRIPMSTETNRQVREMLSHVDQLLRQS
ncbi:MAG: hypothetical protein ACK5RS_10930, partial [Acidobacteriota bacterium]